MRAYAAKAASDTQRAMRSEPGVTAPPSIAHRPPGTVAQTPLAGVRGLAPSQFQYLQRTVGNHQMGELLRRASVIGSPVQASARRQVQEGLGQGSRSSPAHTEKETRE